MHWLTVAEAHSAIIALVAANTATTLVGLQRLRGKLNGHLKQHAQERSDGEAA